MNPNNLKKDESIKCIIANLTEKLGENYFDIVDHWKDDLCAIGISSPSNNEVLVYIATSGNVKGYYDVHLELPPETNDAFPYKSVGEYSGVNIDKLIEIIHNHFKKSSL